MKHHTTNITTDTNADVLAQAPIIISASRATDIPAFYTDWFFNRLEKGYIRWRNPFNGVDSYVSFSETRFIVFWSKNPARLIPYLDKLKRQGIGCYIHFTLNDYEQERIEPRVPSISFRIDTFKRLVDLLGLGSVVWRFDPFMLTDRISADLLLDKIAAIAEQLDGYTEKLVFSFADISSYKKVGYNLSSAGVNYQEWDEPMMIDFSTRLASLNHDRWNLQLATCSEEIDLSESGIKHNRCIDPELIARISPDDTTLQNFLYNVKRDTGQRRHCGCILSKDIGSYNTCAHGCAYCYANISSKYALANLRKHHTYPNNDSII